MAERRPRVARHHVGLVLLGMAVIVILAAVAVLERDGSSTASLASPSAGPAQSWSTPTAGTSSSRSGPTSSPAVAGPLTIVALGDSVPSASSCGCTGYVELLGTRLAQLTGRTDVVHNDAIGGWTSSDVVSNVTSAATSADLRQADLVLVEIGANDFDLERVDDPSCLPADTSPCWSSTLSELRSNLALLVDTVRRVDQRPDVRIALIGYWNVTLDGVVGQQQGPAFVTGSDALTRTVNAAIAEVAAQSDTLYVDAYTPLKGVNGDLDPTNQLLDDGDHPNQSGHQLLMQAVLSALAREGAVTSWEHR